MPRDAADVGFVPVKAGGPSLPHIRAMAIALLPFKNPITEATGGLGGMAMHM